MCRVWCFTVMFDLATMRLAQLFFLASVSTLNHGFLFGCNCGRVEPPDPYVFFNDMIVMNCTLKSVTDTMNSSVLAFVKYSSNMERNEIPSEIIDDKTIMMRKIARPGDEGNYYCEKPPLNAPDSVIGGQVVKLEYKPPKLENDDMTCILYNWGVKMECSWELPFLSMHYINVTLDWYNGGSGICPTMNKNKTMCTWDRNKDNVALDVGGWQFRLTIMNTRANVQTESFFIKDVLKFVKPNKVMEFSISFTNDSHCVVLSWEYDQTYSHRLQFARIRYVSKRSSVVSTLRTKNNHDNITICSLIPYMEYNFTIDVKPDVGGYWSDPEVKTFTTDEDVPSAAPEMRPGYYEHSFDGCKVKNTQHTTRIFWKQIPKDKRNGVITGYNIVIKNLDTQSVSNTNIIGEQDTSKSLQLNCKNKYNVTVRAKTKKGVSPYASSLLIPDGYSNDLIPPKVIVEIEEDKTQESLNVFNVSWTVKEAQNTIHGFSVHYCRGSGSGTCQEELQSVNVSAEKRWLLLRNLDGFYLIGVSIEYAKFSSGLSFTSCVYKKDQVPPVPSNVEVHTQVDNTLTVTWGPTNCDGNNPYVIKYRIYWCKATAQVCSEPMKSHEVMSSDPLSYDLTNLEKDQKYGVQVTAHSYYQSSQRSEIIFKVPKNSDLDAGAITGISFAVIFVLALCLAGIVFCIRTCRDNVRKFNKELPIEVPAVISYQKICTNDGLDQRSRGSSESSSDGSERKNPTSTSKREIKNTYRQNSDESGFGSMNEDDHQRSSPPSSTSQQSSNHLPVVNEENSASDNQNGYQSLDNPRDQSKDSSKQNSLICIPSEGYSMITSPDDCSNNNNMNDQSFKDDTSEHNATPNTSHPSDQDPVVMHVTNGYCRPEHFLNIGNGSGVNGGTGGSFPDSVTPSDMSNSTLSDYVREARATSSPGTSSGAPSDYVRETRATSPPSTSSGAPSDYVTSPPGTSSGLSSDYVRESGATSPPGTSSGAPLDYVRETRATSPTGTSCGAPSDYMRETRATSPPGTSGGAPSDYVRETRATSPPGTSSGAPSDYVTSPPGTSSGSPSDYVRETRGGELPTASNGVSSDYVSASRATVPDSSSGALSDYVKETRDGEPPTASNDASSDYVSALTAVVPPDSSSGALSDYVKETRGGEPPTASNDVSSDYVSGLTARVSPDSSSGAPSDYIRETRAEEPPTLTNGMSSDYIMM